MELNQKPKKRIPTKVTRASKVKRIKSREYGDTKIQVKKNCSINPTKWKINSFHRVWMSHGDSISRLPKHFNSFLQSKENKYVGIANEKEKIYGLQFHPEVFHTKDGKKIIQNFLLKICLKL